MLPNFKSILCLNGRLPDKTWFLQRQNVVIIAADGAGSKLINNDIIPDFIIGDLDSIEKKHLRSGCNIIHIADQDTTDFEKCLVEMQARSLFPSLILGITGGEIDHSIYNLNCFMQHAKNNFLCFLDVDENNKYKLGLPIFTQQKCNGQVGKTISLLPFPEAVVSTMGLKWDISNALLSVSGKASVRNMIVGQEAIITIHKGTLLGILDVVEVFAN